MHCTTVPNYAITHIPLSYNHREDDIARQGGKGAMRESKPTTITTRRLLCIYIVHQCAAPLWFCRRCCRRHLARLLCMEHSHKKKTFEQKFYLFCEAFVRSFGSIRSRNKKKLINRFLCFNSFKLEAGVWNYIGSVSLLWACKEYEFFLVAFVLLLSLDRSTKHWCFLLLVIAIFFNSF